MMRPIDLLPASYHQKIRQRRVLTSIVGAGVVLVALLLVWMIALNSQISSKEDELADVRTQIAALDVRIAELQEFADLFAEVTTKRVSLQTVMVGDVDWPALMTEVAMVLPGEVWLGTLSGSAGITEGSSPVGTETAPIRIAKDVAFGRLQFSGKSLNMRGVAEWLIRLASVDEFDAIWLNDANEEGTGQEGVQTTFTFSNTIELNIKAASERFVEGFE